MFLINKHEQENPELSDRSFLRFMGNDVKKVILFDIVKYIINTSEFVCSTVNEVEDDFEEIYVKVEFGIEPEYLSLFSKEFSTVVYFLGLSKGVKLDEDEIFEISGEVGDQVSGGDLASHFVEKSYILTEGTA